MTQLILALALALGLGAGAASTGADPSLDAAKRLYDDAAYEEALAMLDQLSQADALPREIGVQVQEYRSLCLYALGRTEEADAAMEALVRAAPLFEPSAAELPPRIDELFTGVRRRLLPGLIRERYRAARAAIEQRQFASAQAALTDVQRMIEAAPALGIHDEAISELGALAEGFLELARASERLEAASPAPPSVPAAGAAAASPAGDRVDASASRGESGADRPRERVYDATDEGVTPPVPLRQDVPPMPSALLKVVAGRRGMLEVTIGSDGRVVAAALRRGLHPAYDDMMLAAAKGWRFMPARKDGAPVAFVKVIALDVPR